MNLTDPSGFCPGYGGGPGGPGGGPGRGGYGNAPAVMGGSGEPGDDAIAIAQEIEQKERVVAHLGDAPASTAAVLLPAVDLAAGAAEGAADAAEEAAETAAEAGGGDVTLYRSVSDAEMEDIGSSGAFQAAPNGSEGKWFAESAEDAANWGQKLGHDSVVAGRVPQSVADQMYRNPYLDYIGPARFAENEHLPYIRPIP